MVTWRIHMLGPLEIAHDDVAVEPGPAKQQCLLAVLLLDRNHVVTLDRLVSALWDEPPRSAVANVRTYASRLRAVFNAPGRGARFRSQSSGYLLSVTDSELDLAQFQAHATAGRKAVASGDLNSAVVEFSRALQLWRGSALADLEKPLRLGQWLATLDEQHLTLVEESIDARQRLGEDVQLIGELRRLTNENPLRERLWRQLILSLYRSGDIGGALATYDKSSAILRDELGIDPGPELTELHNAVLRRDPALKAPATTPVAAKITASIPMELPPCPTMLVGRDEQLAQITKAASSHGESPAIALVGPGGVGKSAVAIRAAYDCIDQFPDGQIYVDLIESTPDRRPQNPQQVLARLLRSLGVPNERVPSSVEEASAVFRSMTASRHILVLLDNAIDEAQVRPLITSAQNCTTLVTSRRTLATLDGMRHVELDTLTEDAALALLAELCGPKRIALEKRHAHELAALCNRLPLAIRIASARLVAQPTATVNDLVCQLADECQRLDVLSFGDLAMRSCLDVSLNSLVSAPARSLFQLLGTLHIVDVTGPVAAALMDLSTACAERLLSELSDARLIENCGAGRFTMHDIVRAYAAELGGTVALAGQSAALNRVLDFYLRTARRAGDVLRPGLYRTCIEESCEADPQVTFACPESANRWLEAELPNLMALARRSAGCEPPEARFVMLILPAIYHFLNMHGRWNELAELATLVQKMAVRL